MEASHNKIGENTHVSLKKGIQIFGKSMKKNSGRTIMLEYVLMDVMENMKRHKSPKNSQICL